MASHVVDPRLAWLLRLLPASAASPDIASSLDFNADPPHYLDCLSVSDSEVLSVFAGFGLAHVKLTSTWAEHCPAYYVALNLQDKIMLISVRGTAQVEDVVTDLTALPKVCFLAHTSLDVFLGAF